MPILLDVTQWQLLVNGLIVAFVTSTLTLAFGYALWKRQRSQTLPSEKIKDMAGLKAIYELAKELKLPDSGVVSDFTKTLLSTYPSAGFDGSTDRNVIKELEAWGLTAEQVHGAITTVTNEALWANFMLVTLSQELLKHDPSDVRYKITFATEIVQVCKWRDFMRTHGIEINSLNQDNTEYFESFDLDHLRQLINKVLAADILSEEARTDGKQKILTDIDSIEAMRRKRDEAKQEPPT